LLCHFVLPHSNWECVTVCMSESIAALRRGVQSAMFRPGHHPVWHQTDHSTAATHGLHDGDRDFNRDYASMIAHLGRKPRTTQGACGFSEEWVASEDLGAWAQGAHLLARSRHLGDPHDQLDDIVLGSTEGHVRLRIATDIDIGTVRRFRILQAGEVQLTFAPTLVQIRVDMFRHCEPQRW